MTYDELFNYIAPTLCSTGLFRIRPNTIDDVKDCICFIDCLCKMRSNLNARYFTNCILHKRTTGEIVFAEYIPFYEDGQLIKYEYLEFDGNHVRNMTCAQVDAIINNNLKLAQELIQIEEAEESRRLIASIEQL